MKYSELNNSDLDLDYIKELIKYIKPVSRVHHYNSIIEAKSYMEIKWSILIDIRMLDKESDVLDMLSIWTEIDKNIFYNKNVEEVFGLAKYINSELEKLNKFIEREFTDKPTSEENAAGIKTLDKYADMILAENIAKDFNITIDEVYQREYGEILAKQLYYRDVKRYERKLNDIILNKSK